MYWLAMRGGTPWAKFGGALPNAKEKQEFFFFFNIIIILLTIEYLWTFFFKCYFCRISINSFGLVKFLMNMPGQNRHLLNMFAWPPVRLHELLTVTSR